METSIFLAKALGLYLIIVSLGMIINTKTVRPILINILDNPALLYVTAFMALILGILLVVSHNVWVKDWRVLITITAWLALIKGTVRIIFPNCAIEMSKKCVSHDAYYYTCMGITLIIGLVLLNYGFSF